MSLHVGIGVITFNRKDVLQETVERLRAHTLHANTSLMIADDGSTDGTLEMLARIRAPFVTGRNGGIAWNKNRALFALAQVARCDVVILLEDDTQPNAAGWDTVWVEGAARYGHVNIALDETSDSYLSGIGTVADPIMSRLISAQCAGFSREALLYAGYFDSRFKGYGHEHVEHSARMVRCGYGGLETVVDDKPSTLFTLLRGEVTLRQVRSFGSREESDRNLALTRQIIVEQAYRAPWRDDEELLRFRSEIRAAQLRHPEGFPLHVESRAIPEVGLAPWAGVHLPP